MQKLKRLHRQNVKECNKKECNKKETNKHNEKKESLDVSKILEMKGIDNILFLEKQIKIE